MDASPLALAKSIYQLRNKGNEEQTYKEYEREFYFDQQHIKTSFSLNEMQDEIGGQHARPVYVFSNMLLWGA